jgi:hypothetical protein
MALTDLYNLATADSKHRATVGGAAITAANAILNESDQIANHANRKLWALAFLDSPQSHINRLFNLCLSNTTLLADFTTDPTPGNTDNDAQFVVNSIVSNPDMLARLGFGGEG